MGLFSGIKSTYKKSEAAVVVQNLLEHQARVGLFDLDPAKSATNFTQLVWDSQPDVFNGKFGQRPHKIVVAASALANATQLFDRNDLNGDAVVISLGNILSEIEANGRLYPFNSLDDQLLEGVVATFVEISQELDNSSLSGEIDKLSEPSVSLTWEEWLAEFKKEAGAINPQLKTDEKGISLIDLMEHDQLQRAHKDGVNPKSVAADFAAQFDITKFGQ